MRMTVPLRALPSRSTILFAMTMMVLSPALSRADKPRYDIVITGGRVVDGTGTAWYEADVAIADGKIAAIGRIDPKLAKEQIDATGMIVAPGFIDMMGQTATPMLRNPETALNLLTQGITTINAGEGSSAAPLDEKAGRTEGWTTMGEYFQLLELQGLPVNLVQTIGHTQVREMVLGDTDRKPNDEELEKMRALVREAMEAGAIGVSTALIYPPAIYATTDEIAELAKVAGEYGGRYYTHMRNEGDQLIEAIDESLTIAEKAGTPLHIFHLKTAGQQNWSKMPLAIAKIEEARAKGRDVTADIYPYVNNGLSLSSFIHPRHFAQGHSQLMRRITEPELQAEIRKEMETTSGWENWFRHVGHDWNKVIIGQAEDKDYAGLAGRSLAEIAQVRGEDPWETFFNLARSGAFALPESMTDANKILAAQQEFVSFCTDVGPAGGSSIAAHPRAFGAFPRLLSKYVKQLGAISLERAIAQASAGAAKKVYARDRGLIAEGLAADVIVFDWDKIADKATFAAPHVHSEGVKHVIVNGTLVLSDGKFTGKRPGRVLRGPGYDRDQAAFAVHTGKVGEGLESIDELMQNFMERHRIPGASLAITDQGRLVFARGYGYADVATKKQVEPTSLFRLASVSKPITAVAILQLVEQDKLKMDDKVFDILTEYEPHLRDGDEFDERQREITIEQLLQHRGGWNRDKSFDAMFQSVRFARRLDVPAPAQPEHVICCMLGEKLDFDPGKAYAYSNYGYCLLGRVIEVITKQDYESYVKQHVFSPVGAQGPRLGLTHLSDSTPPEEVRYYHPEQVDSVFADDLDEKVPSAYGGWNIEAMDAHGGWTASAVDLVRLASAFDDAEKCSVLNAESITRMFAAPQEDPDSGGKGDGSHYGCGWWSKAQGDDGRLDSWHGGSLPGTATLLLRRHDGRNLAILFNARTSPEVAHFGGEIQGKLQRAIDQVEEWPEVDYFAEY
ncbi:MAG: serine hydrolase [Pirellulales bacterium]